MAITAPASPGSRHFYYYNVVLFLKFLDNGDGIV